MKLNQPKVLMRDAVKQQMQDWQGQGLKVGFTSGTFDLLHAGHAEYLSAARELCDRLVVGVNSDASVKSYKDPTRPIVGEQERARLIAALEAVDLVFVFDETNNNKNIEILQPDFYIKAGDYSEASLSSAPLVKSYGGEIKLVPFKAGSSSSAIIDQILLRYSPNFNLTAGSVKYERRPAVFLDRDGTLIEHVDYLHDPEQVKFFPGALGHLKRLKDAGFRLVIVTNQPGIGLGYFTKEDFYRVNIRLFKEASKVGVLFDRVYFSPFSKADNTKCRKPDVGMIERAVSDLNLDLGSSFIIGDSTADLQLAKNAGIYSVLVQTGYAGKDELYKVKPDFTAAGLAEAVEHILQKSSHQAKQ